MSNLRERIKENWGEVLGEILSQAKSLGSKAVVAFDLDSTLFDNRPRQARILREYGAEAGVKALLTCTHKHWESGWDMRGAMIRCGLEPAEADRLLPEAKRFWQRRFFTSEYCIEDIAVQGAARFVRAVFDSQALIAYVTGRHEQMREGTIESMRRCEMPQPGERVHLIMKPTFEMSDDDFKREAHAQLGALGKVIAAFDNEPTHVNDYLRKFPEATIVHLATDHSGRPVELSETIVSVPHFAWSP